MDHDTLKSKCYEFYDGELPKEDAEIFSKHLASCQECQLEIELLKKTAQIFFKKPDIHPAASFSQMVVKKILQGIASKPNTPNGTIFDWLSLPRWEVATALSLSFLIFSYFSIDYLTYRSSMESNPMSVHYNQSEVGQWFFSKQEIDREDVLLIAMGNQNLDEYDMETKNE